MNTNIKKIEQINFLQFLFDEDMGQCLLCYSDIAGKGSIQMRLRNWERRYADKAEILKGVHKFLKFGKLCSR
jgi:hypothetical protein